MPQSGTLLQLAWGLALVEFGGASFDLGDTCLELVLGLGDITS